MIDINALNPYKEIVEHKFVIQKNKTAFFVFEIFGSTVNNLSQEQTEKLTYFFKQFLKGVETQICFYKLESPFSFSKQKKYLISLVTDKSTEKIDEKITNQLQDIENIEDSTLTFPRYFITIHASKLKKLKDIYDVVDRSICSFFNHKVLKTQQLLSFFKKIYFPFNEPVKSTNNQINDELLPSKVEFRKKTILIENKISAIKTIVKYPTILRNYFFFDNVFNFEGASVCVKLNNVSSTQVKADMDRSFRMLIVNKETSAKHVSEQIDYDHQNDVIMNLLEDIVVGNEKVNNITFHMMLTAKNKKDLKEKQQRLDEICKLNNFVFSDNLFSQQEAFTDFLPTFRKKINRKKFLTSQIIPTSSFANSFPFTYSNMFDEKGFLLGQLANGGFAFFDINVRDSQRKNSNMFILGTTGSGKSFTIKKILSQLLLKNQKVILLDPEREYKSFAHNFDGTWVDVGKASTGKVNPLQFFPSLDEETNEVVSHIMFLEQFFTLTCSFSSRELKMLIKLIKEFYKAKGITADNARTLTAEQFPTFDDLIAFVINQKIFNDKISIDNIIIELSTFEKDSIDGQLWNGHTTLKLDNQLVILDLLSLSGNKRVVNAQMFLILKFLESVIKNNKEMQKDQKITIAIDEAHLLIDKDFPVALDFIYQMSKRIRKYNGGLIVITQNINDFVGDKSIIKKSTGIINNCQYMLLFQLNSGDVKALNQLLVGNATLTAEEQHLLTIFKTGNCLFQTSQIQRFQLRILSSIEERVDFKT